jgi:calcineurin-like phosphoesterase family protein
MIFITSDPHFGHNNILTYEPNRKKVLGETISEHDANLLKRINQRVKPTDTLIIPGDFSFSDDIASYRKQILCQNVILVLGNHDKASMTQYYKAGFSLVCHEITIKIAKEYVRIRHHPYRKPWYKTIFPWQYKEKDRNKRPRDQGGFLIHGHIHSGGHDGSSRAWKIKNRQINVGVDVWNYYPVSQQEIEGLINKYKQGKFD